MIKTNYEIHCKNIVLLSYYYCFRLPIQILLKTNSILYSQILVISPQNIDDDVLILLADSKIQHLHLLQNCYSPASVCIAACNAKAWRIVKRDNPYLHVHLRVEATSGAGYILLQPEAPVYSIMYQTPKTQVYKTYVVVFNVSKARRVACEIENIGF